MKVNVLGTEYEIVKVDESKDPILKDADGYCDNTIKTCVIGDFQSEQNSVKDLDTYTKKVREINGPTILATGGLNGLFEGQTTGSVQNTATADAIAFVKGVKLSNLEFIQYHPTTIDIE